MSPDITSPTHPDRPIRPLPKRRLRERLSPDVADTIEYPPLPESSTPLFYYPHTIGEEDSRPVYQPRQQRRAPAQEESEDEELSLRRSAVHRQTESPSRRLAQLYLNNLRKEPAKQPSLQPAPSATSSVDGYDSLENSNNKKKRKIPSAGDLAGDRVVIGVTSQGGSLATTAQAEGRRDTPLAPPYYGYGSPATGAQNVPGPGRGRYGRVRNGRSPLRPLADSTNSWGGRAKSRSGQPIASPHQNTTIIADAIANAEKAPHTDGQENQSLLQQQAKQKPVSSQFTFTCDSQVPGSTAWPGRDEMGGMTSGLDGASSNTRRPNAAGDGVPSAAGGAPNNARRADAHHMPPAASQKKKPVNVDRELREQAAARKRSQRLQNRVNPPKPEDIWVCDFCLYEEIYGAPPRHLIRSFEMKERKQRLQEEALKRKMEKMKKDARKGKRVGRVAAAHDHAHERSAPAHNHHVHDNYESDVEEDEYEVDDYEDDAMYSPDEPPPLERVSDARQPPVAASPHPPPLAAGGGGGGGRRT